MRSVRLLGSKGRRLAGVIRRWFSSHRGCRTTCSALFLPRAMPDMQQATAQSHKLMLRAGLVRQSSAGLYHLLPLGTRVLERLIDVVDREMQAIGGAKMSLSILSPASQWKTSGRWESIGSELFRLKGSTGVEYCLSPTHEEAVTELVGREVTSHKQLPLRLYQFGQKFRDELRPRSGLLRAKEFWMKDMYTFDVSEEAAVCTYHEVCAAYETIFARLSLPVAKVSAATGNIGGILSHEYHMTSAAAGEDTLVLCNRCGQGCNQELLTCLTASQPHTLPDCPSQEKTDCQLQKVKGIEVGHTFFLGTKYSSLFKASFSDRDTTDKLCSMGCYGLGVSRLLQAVIEYGCNVQSNGEGLMWPLPIAPYLTCILPLATSKDPTDPLLLCGQQLYDRLSQEACPGHVILDDRTHLTIGARLRDAQLLGYPCTIVIGHKTPEGCYEVQLQTKNGMETTILSLNDVIHTVQDCHWRSVNN